MLFRSRCTPDILRDFWDAVERGRFDERAPRVIEAFVDATSITVVYTSPHWAHGTLGYRRTWPPHFLDDDPATDGRGAYEEISEPLGAAARTLRTDADGVSWWGDLPVP